jgi:HlyD family secretion protein
MMKNKLLLLTVIVASIAGGYWWRSEHASAPLPDLSPAKMPTGVHALGRLEPLGTVIRLATPSGNEGACVAKLEVAEGDDVTAGQLLAVLDTHDRRLCALTEAEANAAAARAKLAQTEAGTKKGDIAAALAFQQMTLEQQKVTKREFERAQALFDKKALSLEEFETRKWAHERATREMHRAEGLLDASRDVREIDVEAQRRMVAVAEAAVATAAANLAATQVRSPIAGRVLRLHARPGEKPSDKGLLELGAVQRMQAVAEIYEGDIARVAVGQAAKIQVETSGQVFHGTVAEVGHLVARKMVLTNDPVSDTDARVVEVRIDIAATEIPRVSRLSNARVQVTLELESKDASLAMKLNSARGESE